MLLKIETMLSQWASEPAPTLRTDILSVFRNVRTVIVSLRYGRLPRAMWATSEAALWSVNPICRVLGFGGRYV